MKRVCVYCGSSPGNDSRFRAAATELGRAMAKRGLELIYGGGKSGLMGSVANAVLEGGGTVCGVIPKHLVTREIAHYGITELLEVETMHQRKAMMIERADGFIALPGGLGTIEEVSEVLSWAQMRLHQKPIGLVNTAGFYDPFAAFFNHLLDSGFVSPESKDLLLIEERPGTLLDRLAAWPGGA